jgi:hypothetical protein
MGNIVSGCIVMIPRTPRKPLSLPELIVETRQCRVLTVGNVNSDATGIDIIDISQKDSFEQASCLCHKNYGRCPMGKRTKVLATNLLTQLAL